MPQPGLNRQHAIAAFGQFGHRQPGEIHFGEIDNQTRRRIQRKDAPGHRLAQSQFDSRAAPRVLQQHRRGQAGQPAQTLCVLCHRRANAAQNQKAGHSPVHQPALRHDQLSLASRISDTICIMPSSGT